MNWYKLAKELNRETIWSDPNWRGEKFPIFKNPNQADFDYLIKRHKEEFPNDQSGMPKTRVTYDKQGNAYRWMSGDSTHYHVEEFLKKKLNTTELSQNRYDNL